MDANTFLHLNTHSDPTKPVFTVITPVTPREIIQHRDNILLDNRDRYCVILATWRVETFTNPVFIEGKTGTAHFTDNLDPDLGQGQAIIVIRRVRAFGEIDPGIRVIEIPVALVTLRAIIQPGRFRAILDHLTLPDIIWDYKLGIARFIGAL